MTKDTLVAGLFGTIIGIDPLRRVAVTWLEVAVPVERVGEVIGRFPTVDTQDMKSWANLTLTEAEQLVALEDSLESGLPALRALFAGDASNDLKWCLFYSEDRDGQ